jgi:aminoglycoside phosphotransferase (APT) family kinase protein
MATGAGPASAATHSSPAGNGSPRASNLLVSQGRLSAVIDFGIAGVGDPACDTAITWTFFTGSNRRMYKERLPADHATWARGRGWALWKALITLVRARPDHGAEAARARDVICAVLAEHSLLA